MLAPARVAARVGRVAPLRPHLVSTASAVRAAPRSTRPSPVERPPRTAAGRSWTTTRRQFSVCRPRRMAAGDEPFDPRTVERESDQVDVCIVGGGKSSRHPLLLPHGRLTSPHGRPRRAQRRHPPEAARQRGRPRRLPRPPPREGGRAGCAHRLGRRHPAQRRRGAPARLARRRQPPPLRARHARRRR